MPLQLLIVLNTTSVVAQWKTLSFISIADAVCRAAVSCSCRISVFGDQMIVSLVNNVTYSVLCCCRLLYVCVILHQMEMSAVVNYTNTMFWLA